MSDTYILEQLKDISNTLSDMKVTLAENTKELTYHIRRTDILETQVEHFKSDINKLRGFFTIAGWIVGACATLLVVATNIKSMFK